MEFQETIEDGEEDRISGLPDCMLLEILSRLPSTTQAIRTGALSKRWKHLWTMVPTLIFRYYDADDSCPFIIDETLSQCRQLKLKRFEAPHIGTYDRLQSDANNLIGYAIKRNVEELCLMMWELPENDYQIDQCLFISSCLTDLRLSGCILKPTGAISWRILRSLYIYRGELNEDLIENILSGSPVLETLVLDCCRRLDITSKSVKKLVFSGCKDFDFMNDEVCEMTEINAPNISSLIIHGDLRLWKVWLVNMSSLVKANLDYTMCDSPYWITHEDEEETMSKEAQEETLKGLIINLRHAKELNIGRSCSEVMSRLEAKGFVFPSNLKFPVEVTW